MADEVARALSTKIGEQMERLTHLLSLVPSDRLSWRPDILDGGPLGGTPESRRNAGAGEVGTPPLVPLGELLGHLLECLAGFCAALYKIDPPRLSHLAGLRDLAVNQFCDVHEASGRISQYRAHIAEGLAMLTDTDLAQTIPTVFAPAGESAAAVLLGNLEHLINHKFQLFIYLRLLGVPVTSRDLYQFREIDVKDR